jgi:predicted nucleotidyltransferase component of viral defense system
VLRPDTEQLWDYLRENRALRGFVLVGGTALSMHLHHRISEDLDFMIPQTRLPRRQIEGLRRMAREAGFPFVPNDSIDGVREFEDTGMDYWDYMQDYVVGGTVKLTLVAPDPEVSALLLPGLDDRPRLATLHEIFKLKCIACANRTKSRDWLDMYVLLTGNYFKPADFYAAFEEAGVPMKFDIAMQRMCKDSIPESDEGYDTLLPDPPTIAQMQEYFIALKERIEEDVALQKASALPPPG